MRPSPLWNSVSIHFSPKEDTLIQGPLITASAETLFPVKSHLQYSHQKFNVSLWLNLPCGLMVYQSVCPLSIPLLAHVRAEMVSILHAPLFWLYGGSLLKAADVVSISTLPLKTFVL